MGDRLIYKVISYFFVVLRLCIIGGGNRARGAVFFLLNTRWNRPFWTFFLFFVSTNQYIFERLSLRACLFVGVLWTRSRRDYENLSGKSLHIYVPVVTMWLLVDKFYMKAQKVGSRPAISLVSLLWKYQKGRLKLSTQNTKQMQINIFYVQAGMCRYFFMYFCHLPKMENMSMFDEFA